MWIVTTAVNAYDQYGEYFVAVFLEKPDFKQLKDLLNLDDVTTGKLTRGGGRHDSDDTQWWILEEVQPGLLYHGLGVIHI